MATHISTFQPIKKFYEIVRR